MEILRDPDGPLIEACSNPNAEGFQSAFEELFHRYRDRAYAIAYRITGNQADALDALQEGFALVFRKLASFRGDSLFSTWFFRIVVNSCIDHRRRNRSHNGLRLVASDDPLLENADPSPDPRDAAAAEETSSQVQQAIAMLSPKLRAILALRYLESMSYEQLATVLGLSLGTVKSRLARACVALEHVVRTRFPQLEELAAARSLPPAGGAG